MKKVFFRAVPFVKAEVTRALEAGADGLIVPDENLRGASALARCETLILSGIQEVTLSSGADAALAASCLDLGQTILLNRGWEIIPVENLLAHEQTRGKNGLIILEARSAEEAKLAAGILEKGVETIAVPREGLDDLKDILASVKGERGVLQLTEAVITEISGAGMGERVCVDTLSIFQTGQGMLTGNSAAFTFLVNAETEHNEYVAARPFRINAGAVHAYAMLPNDASAYLQELRAGSEVLIADYRGGFCKAVVGRVKVERRPMLLVRARAGDREGGIFLQNAETIRLVRPGGEATSVVELTPGDSVLCRLDEAGRHFGMRIKESIREE
ncbi:MAG: 3-dehydroquinate synthase II family protein [Desulfovibrio sp.]|jgi:3-dehydroquinate synthase II|nr:3-dehydroquinate synthase II family protein [Desulfovibrio sp.]